MDVQFVAHGQVVCSSLCMIDGVTYPCIDIYDLPQSTMPISSSSGHALHGTVMTSSLPTIPLFVSFRLPPLKFPRNGCIWSQTSQQHHINHFNLGLPQPSEGLVEWDQVMTFRLDGQIGQSDLIALQGVISLSRLQTIVQRHQASVGKSSTSESPIQVPSNNHLIQFNWNEWSSAASIEHAATSAMLQPKGTQVATMARSHTDQTRAVMIIQDYNQQLLHAPPEHLNRNLGHPTKNRPAIDDRQIPAPRSFKVINVIQSLQCQLFEGIVYYGLGHTTRVVQLGEYRPDIRSSKLFWDCDQHMIVISHQQGVSLRHG
jgi:hypothetical protein